MHLRTTTFEIHFLIKVIQYVLIFTIQIWQEFCENQKIDFNNINYLASYANKN